jgi:hypothetical protein
VLLSVVSVGKLVAPSWLCAAAIILLMLAELLWNTNWLLLDAPYIPGVSAENGWVKIFMIS